MDESGQVSDSLLSMLSDKNFEEVDDAGPDDINEECDDVFELPEHEFVHGTIMGKSGNKAGVKRSKVNYIFIRGQCLVSLSLQITLYMGPYQFRKRSTRSNGIIQFTCVSCETNHRKFLTAQAEMSYDEDDKEHYSLVSVPDDAEHMCWRTGFENYHQGAVQKMRAFVQEDPTRQITQIYDSVS